MRFKERAEILTIRLMLTQLLAHAFRDDPDLIEPFTRGLQRSIDDFEFKDGWSTRDELRGREYMRMAADTIIGPALRLLRKRR